MCVFSCLCVVLFFFFCCLSSLVVSACRQGAPALAPHQPASCVHSALPPAAGKLVAAICHGAYHTLLSHVLLFLPLRQESGSVCSLSCVCVWSSVSETWSHWRKKSHFKKLMLNNTGKKIIQQS